MPSLTLAGAVRSASAFVLLLALAGCDSDAPRKSGSGPGGPDANAPAIFIADARIAEGDAGTRLLDFTVMLSAASQRAVTVRFQSADATASGGVDYQPAAGNLTFTPGQRTRTLSVTVNGDTVVEPDEHFTLTLSDPNGATLGRAQATGTIVADDSPGLATLSIDNVETTEGDDGLRELRFEVTRGGETGTTVTVTAASRDGSATAGSDYVALAPTLLSFGPGETRRIVAVTVNGDGAVEPDEALFVDLSAASANALITDGEGAGVIRNDDSEVSPPLPAISILDAAVDEGDAGTTPLVFDVTLSAPSAQAVTVQFATEGQSATADDFAGAAGTVTFAPNDTAETVTVEVHGDTALEPDETFRVVLSQPVNATVADGAAVGTLRNDDAAPGVATFRIDDVTLAEGNSGATVFSFTVTREGDLSQAVTVQAATADDTATLANNDYTALASTTLSFAANEASKPVEVSVNGDTAVEPDETFTVELSNPSENAMVADDSGSGTITNDDEAPPVACTPGSFCVGVAKRSITPAQQHIDGVEETRFGLPKVQKFNLGGFGINPLQNFPDPFGGFAEALTEPASERVFSGSLGPEHTFLRAMVMQQTGEAPETVLFLMADAVGAGNVIQQNLKAAVLAAASAAGVTLKPENILFGQTHSHAGADLQGLWGGVPQDWINNVLYKAAAEATVEALASRKPARLTLQQGQNLAFNNYRRPRVDPLAEADGTLTLLTATGLGEGGAPIGSILQYNAHPVSINEDPRVPHADYIQGAMDWLENPATGPGGVALYYNGPIADASGSSGRAGCEPAAQDADYGNVRCRGEGMADAAQDFAPRELAPTLAARSVEVILPVTNPAFVVAGGLGAFNRYYDFTQIPAEQIPGIGPQVEAGLIDLPQLTPTARTLVSRITIGGADNGLEIVTIPGEATNTFGRSIRALTANPNMMLLGLTQQSFGYIIPEEEFSYIDPAVNCVEPSDDPFCNAGFLAPFTGYEEFVSLGPLTAPLLRLQGYNVLFDAAPDQSAPGYLRACADPMSPACIVNILGQRIDYIQRSYARTCRANGAPEAFCALLDPATPLRPLCDQQGFPEGVCSAFGPPPGGPPSDVELAQPAFDALIRGCDILDPSHCLLPFPNDHFTVAASPGSPQSAAAGGTGKRVFMSPLATPRNIAGKPIDPTEWNRNDGFSPGQLIVSYVPGLAANADGTIPGAPKITDPGASLDVPQSSVVVLEAGSGLPHPVWAEIDLNAGFLLPADQIAYPDPTKEKRAALLVRPAVNFKEGQRYVVVLKNLRGADNALLPAQTAFRACATPDYESTLPPVAQRCAHLRTQVFPTLVAAGIAPEGAYLAWDFTVASAHNTVGRMKAMRDDAFVTHLGQQEDAAGNIVALGAAPGFTVDRVTADPQTGIARRIEGTLTVPSYVTPVDPSPAEDPALTAVLAEMQAQFPEDFEPLFEALGLAGSASLPPNRLFYQPHADQRLLTESCAGIDPLSAAGSACLDQARYGDGLPDSNGTMTTRYMCQIPASATPENPARPGIYGHGLLDGRQAVTYDGVPDMSREYNFLFCAVDLFGFASGDLPNVASTLVDLSNFAVIPDGSQQGLLNYAFLARLLKHPQGFASHEAFQSGGREVFDRREVFYDGNSQGGIVGGAAVAVSKDVNRGVLGVVGMNYSTLLRRSVDFDGTFEPGELPPYALPLYLSYQDDLDRDLAFALIQMLWDRSENNGYAHHISDNTALEGPDNQVLLHPAFADHQVTHWSAHVMARTVGVETADLYQRKPGENVPFTFASKFDFFAERDPDTADFWDLPLVGRDAGAAYDTPGCPTAEPCRSAKSALIEYDEGRTAIPPIGNVPPRADDFDPHGHPRRTIYGRCQKSHFLHTNGRIIDVRGALDVVALGDCPGLPPPAGSADDLAPAAAGYGAGLSGAVAQFFASLHGVVTALLDGDYETAAAEFEGALTQFAGAAAADPAPGVDARETIERALTVNREVEPVVLTGERFAAWSAPAAFGTPYPYPSGAGMTGDFLPEPLGATRDAHNGEILYPLPGSPMGVAVERIAAYRYQNGGFVEVPVQVDQRFPYFLANDRSDFSFYSGTDEELSYQWDVERWGDGDPSQTTAAYSGAMPDPVSGLDHDDEIAFMARDAGAAQAPPGAMPADSDPAGGVQEVVLTDPLLAGAPTRFMYLALKAAGAAPAFAGQMHYVNYDRDANADQLIDRHFFRDEPVNGLDPDPERLGNSNSGYGPNRSGKVQPGSAYYDQPQNCAGEGDARSCDSTDRFPRDGVTVTTDSYLWRATGRWMIREIGVAKPGQPGVYGPDLIDRWKGRAFQQSPDSNISVVGFEDEQVNWEGNATLLGERCGPVRCMREVWGADSGTNVTKTETFYRDAVTYRYRVRVHPIPPDGLYTSWDYNRGAMISSDPAVPGGRYFTALRPQGVPVDGVNDDVGQVDGFAPVGGQCPTLDGPQPPDSFGRCPAFFDAADLSFNLPLAFDNWEQVSGKGDVGSLVYIFEIKGATSLLSPLVVPYYRDDACLDDGTGDDPVQRPWPGESVNDPRVTTAYAAMAGKATYAEVQCHEKQGAHASHGIHYFFTGDTDNAFVLGKPNNEIDGQQWQFMVPTAAPRNVGDTYANVVRAPLQALVVPRPGQP